MAYQKHIRLAVLGGAVAIAGAGHAITVASFVDPAANGSAPLFTLSQSQGLSGGWSHAGLELSMPVLGQSVQNARFEVTSLPIVARVNLGFTDVFYLGGGTMKFYDEWNNLVLTAEFGGATLYNPYGAGVADLVGHDVRYSGNPLLSGLNNEQFSFSFANRTYEEDIVTYTASLSATAVPEPITIGLAALGLAAATRMRRRR